MPNQENFFIQIGKFNDGIMLNWYKGEVSLVSANEGKDGTQYIQFAFPRDNRTKEPKEVAVPMGIRLGKKDQAIGILKQLLMALEGNNTKQQPPVDDDIPF